ncbi:MAG TPA: hypothetical protein VF981_16240 [Gemmatimonadaceae bacterium]
MKATIIVPGAILIAAGTWIGFPTASPVIVGALIGVTWPHRPAFHAALAALAGWSALLGLALLRGDASGMLVTKLAGAMRLPSWALVVATLAYPVVLAASAAWLAHFGSPRRERHRPPVPPEPAVQALHRRAVA